MRAVGIAFGVLALIPALVGAQGEPIGPEFRVNTYTPNNQGGASVAVDSSASFIVVWGSFLQDGSNFGIFGQRYSSSGAPAGSEFRVNTYTTSRQSSPSVAVDSSGNFVVVWNSYEQDGSYFGVFGQRYASSGTPLGPEFRVNTYTTGSQEQAFVASDLSGNFVVVWSSYQDGSGYGVFGQRYAGSGTPLGPEFLVNAYTTGHQGDGSVSTDASGNFVVVWSSPQDGSYSGVFGQRYASSGAPVGPEFRVNTVTAGTQSGTSVASDSAGNFIVVWASGDGYSYGVFGQRYASSGTPLGPEFRVNTYTTLTQFIPSVTADASGNFVVVWMSATQDGSGYAVFGQRYASSGMPLGPEFRVNTYSTNNQFFPSVADGASGDFVVVWHSDLQDGSSGGVFGQRFNMIVPVELMDFRIE
jgi:hypothetical protein